MYKIFTSLCACAIVWAIWFYSAKKKNNTKQMLSATQLCLFAFITYVWGILCGAVCIGAYYLIEHVKKTTSTPTEKQPTTPPQETQPTEEHSTDSKTFLFLLIFILFIIFLFFYYAFSAL